MPDDEKELPVPGPEEAAGAARAPILGAGKHDGGCVLLGPSCWLLPWVPVPGGPSALRLRSCAPRLGEQVRVNRRATELSDKVRGEWGVGEGLLGGKGRPGKLALLGTLPQ